MSLEQLGAFLKDMAMEGQEIAMKPQGSGEDLARAFSELSGASSDAKIEGTVKKLAAFGQHKGFDVTEDDVRAYIENLKNQYVSDPFVASMMDQYCASTCHIGSAVGGK